MATKTAQSRSTGTRDADAIALLEADHAKVSELIEDYEGRKDDASGKKKAALANQICEELQIHAQIEEEIFYPALRDADESAAEALDEALVEHATIKNLVQEVMDSAPDDSEYDAKVKVIGEYVTHHVEEEEKELFKIARKAELDLDELGAQLASRKAELKAQLADGDDDEEDEETSGEGDSDEDESDDDEADGHKRGA